MTFAPILYVIFLTLVSSKLIKIQVFPIALFALASNINCFHYFERYLFIFWSYNYMNFWSCRSYPNGGGLCFYLEYVLFWCAWCKAIGKMWSLYSESCCFFALVLVTVWLTYQSFQNVKKYKMATIWNVCRNFLFHLLASKYDWKPLWSGNERTV